MLAGAGVLLYTRPSSPEAGSNNPFWKECFMQRMMRILTPGLLTLGLVLAAERGFAACTDTTAVAAARAQVATDCPCDTASNHGQHVKCAGQVAKDRANNSLLPKNCKGAVKSCAAKSTCGKAGAVRCCITKGSKTKCKVQKDVAKCTAKGGVSSGTGSCCDACSPSGAFLDAAPLF
jgi:hypothetical protein